MREERRKMWILVWFQHLTSHVRHLILFYLSHWKLTTVRWGSLRFQLSVGRSVVSLSRHTSADEHSLSSGLSSSVCPSAYLEENCPNSPWPLTVSTTIHARVTACMTWQSPQSSCYSGDTRWGNCTFTARNAFRTRGATAALTGQLAHAATYDHLNISKMNNEQFFLSLQKKK